MSKSSAPQTSSSAASSQTSPSATTQNNSTSQSTSAVSASPSVDSTDSKSADTSEANTESAGNDEGADYLTTDITFNNDTRIVTKKRYKRCGSGRRQTAHRRQQCRRQGARNFHLR